MPDDVAAQTRVTGSPAAARPIIEIRDVTKKYVLGDVEVHALRGVSVSVARGEFVAIMGSSGSGKSTLMNMLGCLDRPSSGEYLLEGLSIGKQDEPTLARVRSRRIGFVFQSFNLLARTSALENVALPLLYSGQLSGSGARARDALTQVNLGDRERNHPSQLSGGQQQRVAIARALINNPAILLADEPTGNLDSATATEIMRLLRTLNRERGLTVILVTHEPDMAAYADRIITMRDGVIVTDVANTPSFDLPKPKGLAFAAGVEAKLPSSGSWSVTRMAMVAAARAIARNKLRSALTMLGMFIGVAALIAMVAVGEGANSAVRAQIEKLGTSVMVAVPGSIRTGGVRGGQGSATRLKVADAEAIQAEATAVALVSYRVATSAQVVYRSQNWQTRVEGNSPNYFPIRSWNISNGRLYTDDEERDAARVAVLGQTVAKNLFGEFSDPVGATVMIKNVPMEVIGVLEAKGQTGFGQDQDDIVIIPFTTAERKVVGAAAPQQQQNSPNVINIKPATSNPLNQLPRLTGFVNSIYMKAVSPEAIPTAMKQVTQILRERHRLDEGEADDFFVRNLSDAFQAQQDSAQIMSVLLASVASISLLVGGIGIMNILLVSVTERTREIGIRMAIGARRVHVLFQFLVEAVLLSTIGGGIGVIAGAGVSELISRFAGWPTYLSPMAMIGAFVFSATVGIFFGYYPARRASLLNPIEALRYE